MRQFIQKIQDSKARFALSEQEAERRFKLYGNIDPYPDILPALLNSADIEDYVAATGMIMPFKPNKDTLKPASYEVELLGKCIYWDEQGAKQVIFLERGTKFVLKKNSIAFVTLEPTFRLPDYIALRFNLRISHVYKGLLLGTGPLVDPGFTGKLSIPLHNLTNNDYTFQGGEGLIWMEFTKVSRNSLWHKRSSSLDQKGEYFPFPGQKNKIQDVEDYLHKADPHRPIRSSIPGVIQEAREDAAQARDAAENARTDVERARAASETLTRRITGGAIVAFVTLAIALAALTYQVYTLTQDSVNYVKAAGQQINQLQIQLNQATTQPLENSSVKIQALEQEITQLRQELDQLREALPESTLTPETSP